MFTYCTDVFYFSLLKISSGHERYPTIWENWGHLAGFSLSSNLIDNITFLLSVQNISNIPNLADVLIRDEKNPIDFNHGVADESKDRYGEERLGRHEGGEVGCEYVKPFAQGNVHNSKIIFEERKGA